MNRYISVPGFKTRGEPFAILALALGLAAAGAYADTPAIPDLDGVVVSRTIVNQAQDFELTLAHPSWDCHTKFSRSASGIVGNTVYIGLAITRDEASCQGPGTGVTFWVAGVIPAGDYVVEAQGFTSCTPHCEGEPLWIGRTAPIELDLEKQLKKQNTAIRVDQSGSAMPKAAWRNGSILLSLPGHGAGNWQVELFAPTGERLQAAFLNAGDAARSSLAFAGTPSAGVYVLRLHSPAQKAQTLMLPIGN